MAGDIVLVDWRDVLPNSRIPNKRRPAIIVGVDGWFGDDFPFSIVVPLTAQSALAIQGASLAIEPSSENGCIKTCYALSWNVQSVPHLRVTTTASRIETAQLDEIRAQIVSCISP